jgi:hypothetical protein
VELQRGMIDRESEEHEEQRIRFRIGVNLGDVIVEEHDIFGDGVNVPARLQALAEPGGICVSRMVRDLIRDKLPYPFDDMGDQSVKNIARPVRAYALRPEGLAALSRPRLRVFRRRGLLIGARRRQLHWSSRALPGGCGRQRPSRRGRRRSGRLRLLRRFRWPRPLLPSRNPPRRACRSSSPFANLSNDPDQQYFADGITEDLTTDLSRIAGMFVISRNSAFTYRNKPADTRQSWGARYALEGSLQRSGKQVRVNLS